MAALMNIQSATSNGLIQQQSYGSSAQKADMVFHAPDGRQYSLLEALSARNADENTNIIPEPQKHPDERDYFDALEAWSKQDLIRQRNEGASIEGNIRARGKTDNQGRYYDWYPFVVSLDRHPNELSDSEKTNFQKAVYDGLIQTTDVRSKSGQQPVGTGEQGDNPIALSGLHEDTDNAHIQGWISGHPMNVNDDGTIYVHTKQSWSDNSYAGLLKEQLEQAFVQHGLDHLLDQSQLTLSINDRVQMGPEPADAGMTPHEKQTVETAFEQVGGRSGTETTTESRYGAISALKKDLDNQIKSLASQYTQLEQAEQALAEKDQAVSERDEALTQVQQLTTERDKREREAQQATQRLEAIQNTVETQFSTLLPQDPDELAQQSTEQQIQQVSQIVGNTVQTLNEGLEALEEETTDDPAEAATLLVDAFGNKLDEYSQAFQQMQEEVDKNENHIQTLQGEISRYQEQQANYEQALEDSSEKIQSLESQKQEIQQQLNGRDETINNYVDALDTKEQELSEAEKRVNEAESRVDEAENRVEKYHQRAKAAEDRADNAYNQMETYRAQAEQYRQENDSLREIVRRLQNGEQVDDSLQQILDELPDSSNSAGSDSSPENQENNNNDDPNT